MIDLRIKAFFNIPESFGLKPLDCPMCLSWWLGLIIGFFFGGVVMALHTAALSLLLERIIYKTEIL